MLKDLVKSFRRVGAGEVPTAGAGFQADGIRSGNRQGAVPPAHI